MFASLDIVKIITMASIGLGLFLIALGIFYAVYRYRLKNPKEYNEEDNSNDILSPYHYRNKKSEKKQNKKLLKTNKILLKEYKKQYNRKEITLEEYQFLTSSLLGQSTGKQQLMTDEKQNNEPMERTVEEDVMDELNQLFVVSEMEMEEYLKSYHFNSLEIVHNIRQRNNVVHLINKKKIILNKINQLATKDLEVLYEIDGLQQHREDIIDLIKRELNDISLLEQNLWDDEFCSIYYLENYVYTYLPEDILNQTLEYDDVQNIDNTENDRQYYEIESEKEVDRDYKEISHNEK